MAEDVETILEYALRTGFPMEKLFSAKKRKYSSALAELIISSEEISQRANEPWRFKSLAQIGVEDFVRSARIYGDDGWEIALMKDLSHNVCRWIYYEDGEGLLFFIREDNGDFRVARNGDDDYDFVRRLNAENSISDLSFSVPPSWAEKLFLCSDNLEAYKLLWYDTDSGPTYEERKKLKKEAVLRETWRRMGTIPGMGIDTNVNVPSDEKSRIVPERAHVSNNLAILNQAATRFWANADRDDRTTHPSKADVVAWLIERGLSEVTAKNGATIIRPEWAPTGRKAEE